MNQIKNKLDPVTIARIKKGAFLALSGPIGLAIIDLAIQAPKSAWWGVLVAYVVPVVINAIREYQKGIDIGVDNGKLP